MVEGGVQSVAEIGEDAAALLSQRGDDGPDAFVPPATVLPQRVQRYAAARCSVTVTGLTTISTC